MSTKSLAKKASARGCTRRWLVAEYGVNIPSIAAIGQLQDFLTPGWGQKKWPRSIGLECSQNALLEKGVAAIIKVSSPDVYTTYVHKTAQGHVSGHWLTLYIVSESALTYAAPHRRPKGTFLSGSRNWPKIVIPGEKKKGLSFDARSGWLNGVLSYPSKPFGGNQGRQGIRSTRHGRIQCTPTAVFRMDSREMGGLCLRMAMNTRNPRAPVRQPGTVLWCH